MPRRRASSSTEPMRGFFAPASSSTSRTLSASCSTADATALMPTIHWFCLLAIRPSSSVLLLAALGRLAARRGLLRVAALALALFHQAEVDLQLFHAGLEHHDAHRVAKPVLALRTLPGEGLADRVEVVESVRKLGDVHQAGDLGLCELHEQSEAGDAADHAVELAAYMLFHPCRAIALVDRALGLVGAARTLRALQRQRGHLGRGVLVAR